MFRLISQVDEVPRYNRTAPGAPAVNDSATVLAPVPADRVAEAVDDMFIMAANVLMVGTGEPEDAIVNDELGVSVMAAEEALIEVVESELKG